MSAISAALAAAQPLAAAAPPPPPPPSGGSYYNPARIYGTPAEDSGFGATSGAEELDALTAANARKKAKLAKLREEVAALTAQLAVAKSQNPEKLVADLAKKQNKILGLKSRLTTAQTEASSKKVAAIVAENKLGQTQAQASAERSNLLFWAAAGVGLWYAWKKRWLKF